MSNESNSTQLKDIEVIKDNKNTNELDLSHKILMKFNDDYFVNFESLVTANLSYCNLKILPESIFRLKKLEKLDISYNQIEMLQIEIGELDNLKELIVEGNPFLNLIPFNTMNESNEILEFFKNLNQPKPKPMQREFYPHLNHTKNQFIVMSYNILAQHCADIQFRFPFTPKKFLKSNYRIPLIKDQIICNHPEIICLQEVERQYFKIDFEPYFKHLGYQCFHCPKARAEKMNDENRINQVIGQATFIKTQTFKVLGTKTMDLRNHPLCCTLPNYSELCNHDEIVLINIVKMNCSIPVVIAIVNIHLYWDCNEEFVRRSQLFIAIESAIDYALTFTDKFDIILAGDFNSTNSSSTLMYLESREECFINTYPLFHVYSLLPKLPSSIDHIFTTINGINPVSVLTLPDDKFISETYFTFPAQYFPSDHLPIATTFQIKSQQSYRPFRNFIYKMNPDVYKPIQKYTITKPNKTRCKLTIKTQPQSKPTTE